MAAYALSAWVVLQIAEIVVEPLGLPSGTLRVLIVVILVAFPVVLIAAWLTTRHRTRSLLFVEGLLAAVVVSIVVLMVWSRVERGGAGRNSWA